MAVPEFGNLRGDAGIEKLNSYLSTRSYISAYTPTQDDAITAAKLLCAPSASKYPHAYRWYRHICSFAQQEQQAWPQGQIKPQKKEEDDDIDLFGDDDDADAIAKLKEKKKEEAGGKKKKEVINKSSLVIEVKPASTETNLDEVAALVRAIRIEGVTWGEAYKKVPIAFGLYKLQLSCVILDDIVNTSDITEAIETLGLDQQQIAKRKEFIETGNSDDEEDEECEGLVQSAEIVSFNKL